MADALELFGREQVERARRYHRPLYAALLSSLALDLAVVTGLVFGPAGDRLYALLAGWPWWARGLAFPALVVVLGTAVRLPLAFWVGYRHEHAWGFSTQSGQSWLADRAKGLAIGLALTVAIVLGLVALARLLPGTWPAAAAPAAAAGVLLLGFVAPLALEPLFNRFAPLADADLAAELRRLAERAGVPVREVLVADASRRTHKVNAYVSGLGRTRRVVLYDTLLGKAEPRELRLVVAHELGHRRARHVIKGTLLGMASAAGGALVLWGLLSSDAVLAALGAHGPGDPRIAPFVLLLGSVLGLVGQPVGSWLSRRFEREADLFSLELTGDLPAFEAAHRALAVSNLSDLDPPRLLYLALFTHPTASERIAAARRWTVEKHSSGGG